MSLQKPVQKQAAVTSIDDCLKTAQQSVNQAKSVLLMLVEHSARLRLLSSEASAAGDKEVKRIGAHAVPPDIVRLRHRLQGERKTLKQAIAAVRHGAVLVAKAEANMLDTIQVTRGALNACSDPK